VRWADLETADGNDAAASLAKPLGDHIAALQRHIETNQEKFHRSRDEVDRINFSKTVEIDERGSAVIAVGDLAEYCESLASIFDEEEPGLASKLEQEIRQQKAQLGSGTLSPLVKTNSITAENAGAFSVVQVCANWDKDQIEVKYSQLGRSWSVPRGDSGPEIEVMLDYYQYKAVGAMLDLLNAAAHGAVLPDSRVRSQMDADHSTAGTTTSCSLSLFRGGSHMTLSNMSSRRWRLRHRARDELSSIGASRKEVCTLKTFTVREFGLHARERFQEVTTACSDLEKCVSLLERSQSEAVSDRQEHPEEVPGALPRQIEQTQKIATERRCKNNDVTTQRMSIESNSYTDDESNNQVGFIGNRLEDNQLLDIDISRKPKLMNRHRNAEVSGRPKSEACSCVHSHFVLCVRCNNFGYQTFGPLPQ
jgi:hypothetical protein